MVFIVNLIGYIITSRLVRYTLRYISEGDLRMDQLLGGRNHPIGGDWKEEKG